MKKVFISNSVKQTHEIARQLLTELPFNLICLYGELGAGKTTFTQGIAKAMKVKKRVISPTFILVREYKTEDRNLVHVDLYRIESEKEVVTLNLPELWLDQKNLVVIEWAEKANTILPSQRIDIKFSYVSESKRKISIVYRH